MEGAKAQAENAGQGEGEKAKGPRHRKRKKRRDSQEAVGKEGRRERGEEGEKGGEQERGRELEKDTGALLLCWRPLHTQHFHVCSASVRATHTSAACIYDETELDLILTTHLWRVCVQKEEQQSVPGVCP